ncbi:MAG: endolytic transglycosylase MltG [bacterium]|nr:endolytic transglycosylase MltG [bacterium]
MIRPHNYIRVTAAFAMMLLITVAGSVLYVRHLDSPAGSAPQLVQITDGMSTRAIAAYLQNLGIIRSARWFEVSARLRGVAGRLEAGNYTLDGNLSTGRILEDLLDAPLELVRVTIPEGLTRMQTASLLAAAGIADSTRFVIATESEELIRDVGVTAATLEGYLFPETYMFPRDIAEEQIARHMVAQFFEIFTDNDFDSLAGLGLTMHQVVTLASIVELEAVAAEERPLIAAIFLRRLNLNRRLESCATVEFALGEHKTHLNNEDLQVKSPYNTYRHRGLPPGPIGNPGAASLRAALHPAAETDYLYFVSRGDGTHVFSKTNAEHESAKRAIYRQARAAARSRATGTN